MVVADELLPPVERRSQTVEAAIWAIGSELKALGLFDKLSEKNRDLIDQNMEKFLNLKRELRNREIARYEHVLRLEGHYRTGHLQTGRDTGIVDAKIRDLEEHIESLKNLTDNELAVYCPARD